MISPIFQNCWFTGLGNGRRQTVEMPVLVAEGHFSYFQQKKNEALITLRLCQKTRCRPTPSPAHVEPPIAHVLDFILYQTGSISSSNGHVLDFILFHNFAIPSANLHVLALCLEQTGSIQSPNGHVLDFIRHNMESKRACTNPVPSANGHVLDFILPQTDSIQSSNEHVLDLILHHNSRERAASGFQTGMYWTSYCITTANEQHSVPKRACTRLHTANNCVNLESKRATDST